MLRLPVPGRLFKRGWHPRPRFALLCIFLISTLIYGDMAARAASGLAETARSPEDVQRFVETHSTFDWGPLWSALKLPAQTTPRPCTAESAWHVCSSELITILGPAQTIVHIQRSDSGSETYLRYMRQSNTLGPPLWRFAGMFQSSAKYFPTRHRILMFANTPFLAVTGQGVNGTGVSSEVESWMDLRDAAFTPVFSYSSEGQYAALVSGYVSRRFRGTVVALRKDPAESVTVSYHMDFADDQNPNQIFHLGAREDSVVFTRSGGTFALDATASTVRKTEYDSLYAKFGDAFSCDQLVHYDFAALNDIAMAPEQTDEKRKAWLGKYLEDWCSDTPERTRLGALIKETSARSPQERE
jgi:hypothetical protein